MENGYGYGFASSPQKLCFLSESLLCSLSLPIFQSFSEKCIVYKKSLKKSTSYVFLVQPFLPFEKFFRPLKLCFYSKLCNEISHLQRFTKFQNGQKRFCKALEKFETIFFFFCFIFYDIIDNRFWNIHWNW